VIEYDFEYAFFFLSYVFLQGLIHFDEILREADGIIVSRGNLGLDLPPEKVVLKPEHGINIMLLVNGL
jgi:pyruvate kinase